MEDHVFESDNLFEVSKQSFVTIGGITKNCLKLIPPDTEKQNLFIGDARGIIYSIIYEIDQPKILIKTEPYQKEIADIEIDPHAKRIYFAVGNSIYSIDKNNDNKWKVEFNIASDIQIFKIIDDKIWTITNNYLNKFKFGEVTNILYTFDNRAKITSLYITDLMSNDNYIILIGTEDDKIKINNAYETLFIIPTKGAPTCFCLAKLNPTDQCQENYYFGTSFGSIGCIRIKNFNDMELLVEKKSQKDEFEVIDMKVYDINYDNKCEIILIRANGLVEIYSIIDEYQNINLICKYETHENLTGLQIGRFKEKEYIEIILSSLSGLVFSLTPEINAIKKLKMIDYKTLKKKIEEEKFLIQKYTQNLRMKKEVFDKKQKLDNALIKNNFKVTYNFSLLLKLSLFQLVIDSEFPMEMVLISCPKTKLDIVKIKTKEVNMNIIDENLMDKETNDQCKFIATFSMKDAIHHLELLVRTYEGQKDEINITIIPYNTPKTAQILKIPVYALSFHKPYEPEYEKDITGVVGCENPNTTNILTIDNISPSEINQILHLIIPNIPEQIEEKANYVFRSTFLNTLLEINIENNKCEIKSPFISTLMTLKRQINMEMELRRKSISTPIKFKKESVGKILESLNPKIQEIYNLEKEYKLYMAFKELGDSIQNQDLPEEYLVIKNKGEEICNNYTNRALNLNYYKQLIEQLFLDIREVYSVDSNKSDEINMLMEDYSFDKLKKIFNFLN